LMPVGLVPTFNHSVQEFCSSNLSKVWAFSSSSVLVF
jgi:hypothetical protein